MCQILLRYDILFAVAMSSYEWNHFEESNSSCLKTWKKPLVWTFKIHLQLLSKIRLTSNKRLKSDEYIQLINLYHFCYCHHHPNRWYLDDTVLMETFLSANVTSKHNTKPMTIISHCPHHLILAAGRCKRWWQCTGCGGWRHVISILQQDSPVTLSMLLANNTSKIQTTLNADFIKHTCSQKPNRYTVK